MGRVCCETGQPGGNRPEGHFLASHPLGFVPLSKFSLGLAPRTTTRRARVGYRAPGMTGKTEPGCRDVVDGEMLIFSYSR